MLDVLFGLLNAWGDADTQFLSPLSRRKKQPWREKVNNSFLRNSISCGEWDGGLFCLKNNSLPSSNNDAEGYFRFCEWKTSRTGFVSLFVLFSSKLKRALKRKWQNGARSLCRLSFREAIKLKSFEGGQLPSGNRAQSLALLFGSFCQIDPSLKATPLKSSRFGFAPVNSSHSSE